MGGIFKKLCCTTSDDAYEGTECDIESPEEFYTYLRLELEDDEISSLKYLFYSIKVAEQQVGREFYKYVTTKIFRKKFKYELDKHRSRIHTEHNLRNCLMDHCFAVMWIHLDILKSIQGASSASSIHKVLYEVAACHINFHDFGELLEIHDSILYKFIKLEFDKYTNKFTLQALEKYLSIISYRINQIKEDMERKEKGSIILKAIDEQRTSFEERIEELNTLRQIYSGIRIASSTNVLVSNPEDANKSGFTMSDKLMPIPSRTSQCSSHEVLETDH